MCNKKRETKTTAKPTTMLYGSLWNQLLFLFKMLFQLTKETHQRSLTLVPFIDLTDCRNHDRKLDPVSTLIRRLS